MTALALALWMTQAASTPSLAFLLEARNPFAPLDGAASVTTVEESRPQQSQNDSLSSVLFALDSLKGIVIAADGRRIALIGDEIVEVGDIIGNYQVLSIALNEIRLSDGEQTLIKQIGQPVEMAPSNDGSQ